MKTITRIALFILVILAPLAPAQAGDLNIIFFSDEQTIAPGDVSATITVQSQDGAGKELKIAETGDLYLTTTSATGEFSSSALSWNPATSFTMSKNSANRNFYYADSAKGTHTMTARLVLRDSGESASASQQINIGVGEPMSAMESAENPSSVAGSPNNISAHNSSVSASGGITLKSAILADAGRERIGVPHSPIAFSAVTTDSRGAKIEGATVTWSFGDGASRDGGNVEHIYMYPGEYVVIMRATFAGSTSVDRVNVRIVPAEVRLIDCNASLQWCIIGNRGNDEINMGRWTIRSGATNYTFPNDSIILAGKSITLSRIVTRLNIAYGQLVELRLPDGTVASVLEIMRPIDQTSMEARTVSIPSQEPTLAKDQLVYLKSQLIALERRIAPMVTNETAIGNGTVTGGNNPTGKLTVAKVDINDIIDKVEISPLVFTLSYNHVASQPASMVISRRDRGFLANLMSIFR